MHYCFLLETELRLKLDRKTHLKQSNANSVTRSQSSDCSPRMQSAHLKLREFHRFAKADQNLKVQAAKIGP